VLTVRVVGRLTARDRSAIEAEGGRLLAFLAPGAGPEVRVVAP